VRIYLLARKDTWWAVAPEIPGLAPTGHEHFAPREEALARCREVAQEEIAAYVRLGTPLGIDPEEQIVEWELPFWLLPDWLVPLRPGELRAAIGRMDELAAEVERLLDEIAPEDWDRRSGSDWSVRLTLDHLASGNVVALGSIEPWPLDPVEAQAAALAELRARLAGFIGRRFATHQFGFNQEDGRIRWTPRKVVRVVQALQEAWLAHLEGSGPEPSAPVFRERDAIGHEDAAGDDDPIEERHLDVLVERDLDLRRKAPNEQRVRGIAPWYRYYRDRLTVWPDGERERWRATREAFRQRLLSCDENDLARVIVMPTGGTATVRRELRHGISHVRGHLAQLRMLAEAVARV
jgi:predicted RNase H-like HicB family nuclease